MKLRTDFLILAIFLLGSWGCQKAETFLGHYNTPYHRILEEQTHSQRFFGLEKVAYDTHITFRSLSLRRAYVNEYAERFDLSEAKREEMLAKELAEAQETHSFVISHYATDRDVAKLNQSEGPWRLSLTMLDNPDAKLEPKKIEDLSSDDAVVKYFYPHVTSWSRSYRVDFPKPPSSGDSGFTVTMTGVAGSLAFEWNLEPTPTTTQRDPL